MESKPFETVRYCDVAPRVPLLPPRQKFLEDAGSVRRCLQIPGGCASVAGTSFSTHHVARSGRLWSPLCRSPRPFDARHVRQRDLRVVEAAPFERGEAGAAYLRGAEDASHQKTSGSETAWKFATPTCGEESARGEEGGREVRPDASRNAKNSEPATIKAMR